MQSTTIEEERNVVPRWRALSATSPWELGAARAVTGLRVAGEARLAGDIERWRAEGNLEGAADIFATGVATGQRALVLEGGLTLLRSTRAVEPQLIDLVTRELRPAADPAKMRERLAAFEQNENYLRQTIRLLKKRLVEAPRDAVSTLELARHYTIVGQYEAAAAYIHRAHALAPGGRMVLRAIVQFHDVVGDIEAALPYLWRAQGLRYDPLIQSAEIAAAEIAGRASRSAATVKRNVKGRRSVTIASSEAALALATLERRAGANERTVFVFVGAGLAEPSENAMAQAVWLGDQSTRRFVHRYPDLEVQAEAYEARAYLLFEAGHYDMALRSADLWSRDQPFQVHAMTFICTTAAIYGAESRTWLPYAETILARHAADFNAVNAAFLCFAMAGELNRAADALAVLTRTANSQVELAFCSAGDGLLRYRYGDTAKARLCYWDAITHSRRARRIDLVFTAAAFHLAGEARYGDACKSELDAAVAMLDKLSRRVPAGIRQETDRLWRTLRPVIQQTERDDNEEREYCSPILCKDLPALFE
jgi:tetratricopeptide (TPR) repeat protein